MDKPCACGKQGGCSCGSDGGKMLPPSYVYAIGKVVHRFPNRSLELELAQATGRRAEEETRGRTREEVIHKALTDPANRYIARQICYVLTIEGLETYILVPTDPLDIDRLAQALRPAPGMLGDIDVIIGRRGPLASPEMCNGLMVPIVMVDQIYSFDRDTLMKAIPKRKGKNENQFKKTAMHFLIILFKSLIMQVQQMSIELLIIYLYVMMKYIIELNQCKMKTIHLLL